MRAVGTLEAEARARLRQNARALAQRERCEGFVLEAPHAVALVMIAYRALKADAGATARVRQRGAQSLRIQWRLVQAEGAHPPATGGRNTTVSPSANGWRQSPNSSLTATRRFSGASCRPRCARSCA